MESGGTRMGSRSSTRYGPSSVFSGPVRKWNKTWVPVPSSSSPSPSPSPSPHASRVLVYKWTPLNNGNKDEAPEDTPVRRVRYVPVSVIEEQRKEAAKKVDEVAQTIEVAMLATEDSNKCEGVVVATQSGEATPMIVEDQEAPAQIGNDHKSSDVGTISEVSDTSGER